MIKKRTVMRIVCTAITASAAIAASIFAGQSYAGETVLFGYEKDISGWEIPDWALEKSDHVGTRIAVSKDHFKEGASALKFDAKFPGGKWTAAYVETQQFFDWGQYSAVSVDLYLPESAPPGLKAKLILTVGEGWSWVEMSRAIGLEPGKWTTVSANLMPGSTDFRGNVDEAFRKDIRKVGVRIDSNNKPAYEGAVYIDNFRLTTPS